MTDDSVIPVGQRLGSERLYTPGGAVDATIPLLPEPDPVAPAKPARARKPKKQGLPPPAVAPERPIEAQRADVNWRNIVSSVLELVGIAAITAGCALIHLWLALIVGGIALVALGVATGLDVTK
jgi:hypothetical protein